MLFVETFFAFNGFAFMQDQPTIQMPVKEKIAQVRPYWKTLSHEQRAEALTLDLASLHQRAAEVATISQEQLGEALYCSLAVTLTATPVKRLNLGNVLMQGQCASSS